MLRDSNEENLVPGIDEDNTPPSDTEEKSEDNLHAHVITDQGESVRLKKNSKASEFTYHNKDSNTNMSSYDRVLKSLKKIENSYNPTMSRMKDSIIEGKYKVTRDTRVIPIVVEHEEDEIQ